MRILSIHPGAHDAAAAVFDGYELIAAVQEDRLSRQATSGDGIPWLAIDEVLRIAGWTRRDVDAIASTRAYYPLTYLRRPLFKEFGYAVQRWSGKDGKLREVWRECHRRRTTRTLKVFSVDRFLRLNGFRPGIPFHFANHHAAHALPALFFTDWDDALIVTADGIGDNVSYSIRSLREGRLECHFGDDRLLRRKLGANSIGQAYGCATRICGFRPFRHEGKLTDLAAYGKPELAPDMAAYFTLGDDGLIDPKFIDERSLRETMERICGNRPREVVAASIQKVTEDAMLALVRFWLDKTGVRRLGLSGGVFANVRLNRLLAESCPLDEIFVFPAMGDDGLCVGAALSFLLARDGLDKWLAQRRRIDTLYFGRDYDAEADAHLGRVGGIRRLAGETGAVVIPRLIANKVGAVYLGRMEFGPRALGGRSIIASPAAPGDALSQRLGRSDFMPFAPCVLEEDAAEVFAITDSMRYAARFMTVTCMVHPHWCRRIPAVVHIDGTARPQILREADNPRYAAILRQFRDATGVPVLVNTGFKAHEEPIVNTPAECARALLDGRVDFVVTRDGVYERA
jgi:carbamoyltransferase